MAGQRRHVGQRRPAPQPERLIEQARRGAPRTAADQVACGGGQLAEPLHVDVGDAQRVPVADGGKQSAAAVGRPSGFQQPAQVLHMSLDDVDGAGWWPVPPERVHDLGSRQRLRPGEGEQPKHGPPAGGSEVDFGVVTPCAYGTENLDPHGAATGHVRQYPARVTSESSDVNA